GKHARPGRAHRRDRLQDDPAGLVMRPWFLLAWFAPPAGAGVRWPLRRRPVLPFRGGPGEVLSKWRRASLSRRLIRENGHPGRNHGGVDEFEVHSPRAVLEQAPPCPEQDRGKQDAVLVDEVVFQQAVREVLTAVNDKARPGLLLERGDALRDVALNQAGVLPLQVPERG